jgi:hypothetical protein
MAPLQRIDQEFAKALRLPNVLAFSCERQHQHNRMLPRQQARGSRRTHRTVLGAKARARNGPLQPSARGARQLQCPCWAVLELTRADESNGIANALHVLR